MKANIKPQIFKIFFEFSVPPPLFQVNVVVTQHFISIQSIYSSHKTFILKHVIRIVFITENVMITKQPMSIESACVNQSVYQKSILAILSLETMITVALITFTFKWLFKFQGAKGKSGDVGKPGALGRKVYVYVYVY